jgi:hypothetical protein
MSKETVMPSYGTDATDPTTAGPPESAPEPTGSEVYSPSEEELVAARLEALGYIE